MGAAVDDVHHRHRQIARRRAANVTIERRVEGVGGGLGDRQGDAEDGVGTETFLGVSAVEGDHGVVDQDLLGGIETRQRIEDLAVHGLDRALDALAAVAIAAVAFFVGFVGAGRRAGRHRGAALRPAFQRDIHFDGGIAAAIDDLAAQDVDDGGHGGVSGWSRCAGVVAPCGGGA